MYSKSAKKLHSNSGRVNNKPLVRLLFYCHTLKPCKQAAEFCHCEKIECFVPYQHKWPNIYIWLCRGKSALFTHTIFVETGCTSKLLRGKLWQLLINSTTQPIMKNMPVVVMAFNIPGSYVYT